MTREVGQVTIILRDITDRRSRSLSGEIGQVTVHGRPCKIMLSGDCAELWAHGRRYELSFEDLFATAGFLIERDLTAAHARRVLAARGVEPASDTTAH